MSGTAVTTEYENVIGNRLKCDGMDWGKASAKKPVPRKLQRFGWE